MSQSAISDIERGRIDRYTMATIRSVLMAVDATATIDVVWGGRGDLDRLLDADHARLCQIWADLHRRAGWETWTEASYSIYGERGRIDLLAFHSPTGVLEVAEMKTDIWDIQDTLGRHDAKIRLGRHVARERGWSVTRVIGALVVRDATTARGRIADHAGLFARYDTRGRAAHAFVEDPSRAAAGLLVFIRLPPTSQGRRMRAGQRRVRVPRGTPSVDDSNPAAGMRS